MYPPLVWQGIDPLDPDNDDDGLSDGDEVNVHGSDPFDPVQLTFRVPDGTTHTS